MAITTHCLAQLTVWEKHSQHVSNKKQKTDLSRCRRAQLPKQPTSCSLFMPNLASGPVHDPYNLFINFKIFQGSVSVAIVSSNRNTKTHPCRSSKSNCISAFTATWRSLPTKSSNTTCCLLSWHTFQFNCTPFPQMTSSHVHQWLTNCEQAPRCCLCLPSNPLTFITTTSTIFVSVACCTRITGNNVGIRGEAWCGLSLCSNY